VSALQWALKQGGYARSVSEVCVLFRALGIQCTETSVLSRDDFMRLSDLGRLGECDTADLAQHADVLGVLQLRRMLLGCLETPQLLLVRSLAYLSMATANSMHGPSAQIRLMSALRHYELELQKPGAQEVAKSMLSSEGLSVFVSIITMTGLMPLARSAAARLISRALELQGGPFYSARRAEYAMDSAMLQWKQTQTHQRLTHSRHEPQREVCDVRNDCRVLEARLLEQLWQPLLETLDHAQTRPGYLDGQLFRQLLTLLLQAHLPAALSGGYDSSVAPQVAAALCRLHGARDMPSDALLCLEFMEHLESTDINEVSTLAAAFGGHRLLRGVLKASCRKWLQKRQAQDLQAHCSEDGDGGVAAVVKALQVRGRRVLREWRSARKRLSVRLCKPRPAIDACAPAPWLHKTAGAVVGAEMAGFETAWSSYATTRPLQVGSKAVTDDAPAAALAATTAAAAASPAKQFQQQQYSEHLADQNDESNMSTDWPMVDDTHHNSSEEEPWGIEDLVLDRLHRRWLRDGLRRRPRRLLERGNLMAATSSLPSSARLPGMQRLPMLPSASLSSLSARSVDTKRRPMLPLVSV